MVKATSVTLIADLQIILEKLIIFYVVPVIIIVVASVQVLVHARRQDRGAVSVRGVVKRAAIARRALKPSFLATEIK